MLIIPAKPIQYQLHTSLAVSTNTWEAFVIRKLKDDVFQLALFKHYNLPPADSEKRLETESAKWYPMAVLDTYEKCKKLFEMIVDAIETDQKVFRVSECLDKIQLLSVDLPTA